MSLRTLIIILAVLLFLVGLLLLWASAAPAGDRQDLEKLPSSCQRLWALEERCRLGPCNVKKIEAMRARCKRDSTAGAR